MLKGALFRYQLMANIVGTLIIPLFLFTGIKIATGHCKLEVEIFGVLHGYLYIVYLITVGILRSRRGSTSSGSSSCAGPDSCRD